MKKIFGLLVIFCVLAIVGCTAEDDPKPPKVRFYNNTNYYHYGFKYSKAEFFSLAPGETTEYEECKEGYHYVSWLKIDGDSDGDVEGGTLDLSLINIDFNSIEESQGTWRTISSVELGSATNEQKYTVEITIDNSGRIAEEFIQD